MFNKNTTLMDDTLSKITELASYISDEERILIKLGDEYDKSILENEQFIEAVKKGRQIQVIRAEKILNEGMLNGDTSIAKFVLKRADENYQTDADRKTKMEADLLEQELSETTQGEKVNIPEMLAEIKQKINENTDD